MTSTTYFRGFRVNLTGKTEIVHGGLFHEGFYAEGPQKGGAVLVSERLVEQERARVASSQEPETEVLTVEYIDRILARLRAGEELTDPIASRDLTEEQFRELTGSLTKEEWEAAKAHS
jgi:hypothetical protein